MTDLNGRRIIVTGGASGMGEGLVRAFSDRGARVISLDVNEPAGARIAAEAGAGFVTCDVSEEESVREAFAVATAELDGLDVLVNAAGIAPSASGSDTGADLWNRVMAVNATGTFLTNVAAFAHLRDQGGRIINFSSAGGIVGYPGKAAYAAAKGAVLAWNRTIAVEWARYSITVNAMAPLIWTSMYDATRASMAPDALAEHDETMRGMIPLGGRLGDIASDLVPVVEFIAGDGSRFMTGQIFAVDGGCTMVR